MALRHGGKILADQLHIQGVRRVFSVPGESFLAALDGLYESGIENVVCRHEGGATMMAEAHGKLTNEPGVAFVTRGPGATNGSSGVHVAMQDSTPMILFVGQIARDHRDRGAFQEVDYRAMFGSLAKWVAEVDQTDRLPEYIARAFLVAQSGRPGPVVLALPEDMLSAAADVPDRPKVVLPSASDYATQLEAIRAKLAQAKRPLLIAGGPMWSEGAAADLRAFAESSELPVAVPFRRQDYLDNRSSSYVGDLGVGMNPELAKSLQDSDLLVLLGAELRDIATDGYQLIDPTGVVPPIIQIHPGSDQAGQVYPVEIAVTARASDVLAQLSVMPPITGAADWTQQLRGAYEAWQAPKETPGPVKMEEIVPWLSENLPEDSILTNGAGNYAAFLHRYFCFKGYRSQVAPTSGSMGYGFPAAIAAKLENPERTVVCLAGDGCFQMTLNECSTAVQHGAGVIVIVVNNGKYGTIRMHQEKTYPGRVSGTSLSNPDFAALANSYGGSGVTVTRTEDFPNAFKQAQQSGALSIIELQLDDEVLSTSMTLSQTREVGRGARNQD